MKSPANTIGVESATRRARGALELASALSSSLALPESRPPSASAEVLSASARRKSAASASRRSACANLTSACAGSQKRCADATRTGRPLRFSSPPVSFSFATRSAIVATQSRTNRASSGGGTDSESESEGVASSFRRGSSFSEGSEGRRVPSFPARAPVARKVCASAASLARLARSPGPRWLTARSLNWTSLRAMSSNASRL